MDGGRARGRVGQGEASFRSKRVWRVGASKKEMAGQSKAPSTHRTRSPTFRSSRSFDPGQDGLPKCRVQREPPFLRPSLEEPPDLVRKTHRAWGRSADFFKLPRAPLPDLY